MPWGVSSINAPALWARGITGKGIKIGIMDSGIYFGHPEFSRNLKQGINILNPSELPLDDFGHGTFVAGVIAANNNNYGVVGASFGAEIYPIKVLDKDGFGRINDIVEGIEWCIQNDINIINMSFAINEDNESFHSAIKKATEAGIIIVASASNSYGGEVGYPASYDEVISVTSVNKKMEIDKKAPRGKVDFSAPGVDIISTSSNGDYSNLSGNSYAAPHITGIIALLMEYRKNIGMPNDRSNLLNEIKKMTRDLGNKGLDKTYGNGFVILNEDHFPNGGIKR